MTKGDKWFTGFNSVLLILLWEQGTVHAEGDLFFYLVGIASAAVFGVIWARL